jgi:hypothetical protein
MLRFRPIGIMLATLLMINVTWALPPTALPVSDEHHDLIHPLKNSAEAGLATVVEHEGRRRTGTLVINSLLLVKGGIDIADLDSSMFNNNHGGDVIAGTLYTGLTVYSFSDRVWRVSGMISGRPTAAQLAYNELPAADATARENAARDALVRLAKQDRRHRLIFGVLKLATGVYMVTNKPFTGEFKHYNNKGFRLSITGVIDLFRPTLAEKAWKNYQGTGKEETNETIRTMASYSFDLNNDCFNSNKPNTELSFIQNVNADNYTTYWSTRTGWGIYQHTPGHRPE